jgi:hypothetical protein
MGVACWAGGKQKMQDSTDTVVYANAVLGLLVMARNQMPDMEIFPYSCSFGKILFLGEGGGTVQCHVNQQASAQRDAERDQARLKRSTMMGITTTKVFASQTISLQS